MDITISIVTYNTRDLLKRCLKSIIRHTKGVSFEVIVVDNASVDGTIEMVKKEFPQVKLIANKSNKFFAKANNQAFKKAKGTYILILNSDTYFVDNSIKKMFDYMEQNPKVGACDGIEVYEDGNIMDSGSTFSTPLIDFYELSWFGTRMANKKMINTYRISNKKRTETFSIDVGCDAFLMVPKKVIEKIGGYDDRFDLYYTENDLCLRIKKLGFVIMHFAGAKVVHKVSASVASMGWRKTDIYYNDLLRYYQKHGYKITGMALFFLLKFEESVFQIRDKLKLR